MSGKWKVAIAILFAAVVAGLINLGGLRRRVQRLSETQSVEEEARRAVLAPPITTPTDVMVQAKIFWAIGPGQIAPVAVQLPLSADPVQRSKQVLSELITKPTPQQRTIPADTELLGFYILPNSTAVADFSDALASETPSGILSEEMTVDSIVQTLENNVPTLRRLKILIHGQEVDTLAGHVDLTGFFDLNLSVPAIPSGGAPAPSASGTPGPADTAAPHLSNAPVPPVSPGTKP